MVFRPWPKSARLCCRLTCASVTRVSGGGGPATNQADSIIRWNCYAVAPLGLLARVGSAGEAEATCVFFV
eukprot:14669414-Alexandrium_andersonii.AAC.1